MGMADMTDTLTLDSIMNNPIYDFMSNFTNNDDDENTNFLPYNDLNLDCKYFDVHEFANKFKNNVNQSFLSINIQSLPSKFGELEEFIDMLTLNKCEPDFICLQETWRIPDPSLFKLKNYNLELMSRNKNVQGGGVGIYIKKGILYKKLTEKSVFIDKVFESLFIEISSPKAIVGSIYRPNSKHQNLTANEQIGQFQDLLTNIVDDLSTLNMPVYILGDFNLDLLKYHESDHVKNYIDMLFLSGFLQLILKPTRCTSNTATLIDHILTF